MPNCSATTAAMQTADSGYGVKYRRTSGWSLTISRPRWMCGLAPSVNANPFLIQPPSALHNLSPISAPRRLTSRARRVPLLIQMESATPPTVVTHRGDHVNPWGAVLVVECRCGAASVTRHGHLCDLGGNTLGTAPHGHDVPHRRIVGNRAQPGPSHRDRRRAGRRRGAASGVARLTGGGDRGAGGRALAIACDVTDRAAVHTAVRQAEARFGPTTTLIANAGGAAATTRRTSRRSTSSTS